MEAAIAVQNLVKRYRRGRKPAVDGLSFTVLPGELFALLGPNGSGKTTTVSILTTMLTKTSGTVRIAGCDLDTQAPLIRRRIGVIFQGPSLDLRLTAEENIRLHAAVYGCYGYRPCYRLMPAAYRNRVGELAAIMGLGADLFKPVQTFSGGMRRKLEVIRSLLQRPGVLFLDEPTAGLDAVARQSLWT
jgi:ABC-2 type transport system ATP-binding protein